MKKSTIIIGIILLMFSALFAIILSSIIANVLYLVYSPNPEEIANLNPSIILNRTINNSAINQMFWIILLCFIIAIMFARFRRFFGLKDYKSNTYKVTDDIEIPMKVGEKQTQQGSSWWLSPKKYNTVFNINTIDPENSTIKKLLHNADEETKAIKSIHIKTIKDSEGNEIIDEPELIEEIKTKLNNLEKIEIPEEESKIFQKGGIVLGRKERNVFNKTSSFPFFKTRKVEDVYYVGDDVHTLTVGATRSGKTRCEVIQSIENLGLAGESMIISDPKGELFEYTSGGLKQLGYNVVTLDFKNPMKSSCYNFLQPVIDEVKKGNIAQAQQKASDICESIVPESKQEKIWENGEKATIKTGIMSVCMEAPEEMQNIANVYYFLANMCENKNGNMLMNDFLDKIKEQNPGHPAIAAFAPAAIAAEKTRASFFASALTSLVLFSDRYIAQMTSKTEIKAEDLANKKTALYMILPDEKLTYYSLCSLFVNQIYQQLVNIADSKGGRLKTRVNFILDEFGNFSPIPNFGGFLTVGGGRGIRFNLFLQSFSQLNSKYDENTAQNILDNCHIWTYLKTSNDTTAEKISKKLGTYTCQTYSESNSGNIGGSSVNRSKSMNISQRALLTPDEVLRINRPYLLVMYSGQNPAMTIAPDLHKWLFNRMLSLGDPAFCTKVRVVRETAREENKDNELKIWDINNQMLREKEEAKAQEEALKQEEKEKRLSEIRNRSIIERTIRNRENYSIFDNNSEE